MGKKAFDPTETLRNVRETFKNRHVGWGARLWDIQGCIEEHRREVKYEALVASVYVKVDTYADWTVFVTLRDGNRVSAKIWRAPDDYNVYRFRDEFGNNVFDIDEGLGSDIENAVYKWLLRNLDMLDRVAAKRFPKRASECRDHFNRAWGYT